VGLLKDLKDNLPLFFPCSSRGIGAAIATFPLPFFLGSAPIPSPPLRDGEAIVRRAGGNFFPFLFGPFILADPSPLPC